MRIALATASLVLVLASSAWSGIKFIEGVTFKQQALDAAQKTTFYQQRYELARHKLPATPVEPRAIKTAVDAVATLHRLKSDPERILMLIGAALEQMPAVQLDQLNWIASADPHASNLGASARAATPSAVPPVVAAAGKNYYQIAEISAHLAPFDGDYAHAMSMVDGLAAALHAQANVVAVEVLRYPLDVRSEASVSGSATGDAAAADFKLKLVLGAGDGHQPG